MGALPFMQFESLEHGSSGADVICHFRETPDSAPERYLAIEAEYMFSNYKAHGHNPSQMPIVICWDLSKNRKVRLKDTATPWKFLAETDDAQVRVYLISRMPNLLTARAK